MYGWEKHEIRKNENSSVVLFVLIIFLSVTYIPTRGAVIFNSGWENSGGTDVSEMEVLGLGL